MSENANKNISIKPNYFYAIFSVALVLFLLGFFGLVLLYSQSLVKTLKEQMKVLVELKENATEDHIIAIDHRLRKLPTIKEESVTFVSKEDAAKFMDEQEGFNEDISKLDLANPYLDAFTFQVKAECMQIDSLDALRSVIRKDSMVNNVYYQETLVDDIAFNVERIAYFALGIGVFFILVAFSLIHNTIRLAMYSNRFLIKNMELVGASWEFISRPYLFRSLWNGMVSGLFAIGLLSLIIFLANQKLPELKAIQNYTNFASLFAALLLTGILINWLSTYYVVNKYLRMRVDDLY
jgi:cell division transport system permease protein